MSQFKALTLAHFPETKMVWIHWIYYNLALPDSFYLCCLTGSKILWPEYIHTPEINLMFWYRPLALQSWTSSKYMHELLKTIFHITPPYMAKFPLLSITFYFHYNIWGCMCSTGPFPCRWLKRYIYSSCYYHHQIRSIHLSHCCHIFRGCVPEIFVTSYSVTYYIYIPRKPGICFHYYCAVYDECN